VLASSGAFLMLFSPLFVSASIFSLSSLSFLLSSIVQETSAAGGRQNSQTIVLLAPARNIDPTPAVGGGDITLVQGSALIAEEGPSGTVAEITSRPESSQISVYTVHKGDTLGDIASMFDVTVNTIMWANDLKNGTIKEGQELVILPIAGVRHTVAKGDTSASLAKKYKADQTEIAQYNNLDDTAPLALGSVVIIPDGEVAAPSKPRSTTPSNPLRGSGGPAIAGYYAWPVNGGVITQGLHGYNGIDIGASSGTNILAAAAGTVIIANGGGGWNGGYGNYLVIQHDNGTQTLYAHASKLYVSAGTRVVQGAVIAAIGRTGKATGSHLHFEVRGAVNSFGR